jgi:hypothetical protein
MSLYHFAAVVLLAVPAQVPDVVPGPSLPTPPAPVAARDADLAGNLITILDTTESRETFCLVLQLLSGMAEDANKAIPAVLRCAERLHIYYGMRDETTGRTREHQLLAEFISARASAYAGQPRKNGGAAGALDHVRQVQLDVCIAELESDGALRNFLPCIATDSLRSNGPGVALGFVKDRQELIGLLERLKKKGRAKIASKTSVATVSGKPGNLLCGGRIAVPVSSGLGTDAVRFEEFGTQLNFLPIVLGNGKIHLEVEPIINTLDAKTGFDTQRMHTTLEMEPTQTFVLCLRLAQRPADSGACATCTEKPAAGVMILVLTPYLVEELTAN